MRRLRSLLCTPLLLPLALAPSETRALVNADVTRWNEILRLEGILPLLRLREFRNLYLYRLARGGGVAWLLGRLLAVVWRPEPTLYLNAREIGPGLFIQHGFATIVTAERVGANCWINQQVTIGFKDRTGSPVLEDDVTVSAGAKVIGPVTVGRGSTVGANAVVVRDVAPGTTAVGVPAHRS
jgi:serine O-acetyltransferase